MPTVSINREVLFRKIGKRYTDEEFDKLCFEYGVELDDVVETDNGDIEYKIDIPANRYDLLCVEGISDALAVFIGNKSELPSYRKVAAKNQVTTHVSLTTSPLRPYIVTAVLRGVKMTPEVYQSMIDLQEKLHHNICRKRALVAIGVHDLDSLKPPFYYSCEPPKNIRFIPLKEKKEFDAEELMNHYENDVHLKPYLHLIKEELAYPVIRDAEGTILSLPPIINGEHSKVGLNTRNIFIECTAKDEHKAIVVLDTLVAMLSIHLEVPYEVEETLVKYEGQGGKEVVLPELEIRKMTLKVNDVNKRVGISWSAEQMVEGLARMGLKAFEQGKALTIEVPPTRHDIIHPCDIIEDVAIAYGYCNIKAELPPTSTIAMLNPLNKLCQQLSEGVAMAGFTQALTFSLCSIDDECEKLRLPRSQKEPELVLISNPKTTDFAAARSSLLPGILKTVAANKGMPLPLKIYEFSDVVVLDNGTDTGTRNVRRMAVVYYGKTPGFEVIHCLLDRMMTLLEAKFPDDYVLKAIDGPTFLEGRSAEVVYKNIVVGRLGVLHPQVLDNFDLMLPCSAVEICVEPFL